MLLPIILAGCVSFLLSLALTRLMIYVSPRVGFVDKPGHRKIHHAPKPLGGGVAIFWSMTAVLGAGAAIVLAQRYGSQDPGGVSIPIQSGLYQQLPLLALFLVSALVLHVMGIIDDRRALGAYPKLLVQLLAVGFLVISMEYLAQQTPSLRLRALTFLDQYGAGRAPSIVLTVLWIVAITNAFNFLDNMDGLSAGVAAICATAFLITAIMIGQLFVAATLSIFIGAVLGFLIWNFPPSRIFMGDSGSLVIGFVLGVLTIRTTYVPEGQNLGAGWYTIFAPVVVLALPLYDLIVVSIIRISRGKSPFTGDTNHFSHRLVARGMSRRTAVLCIYLVTFATSIAAVLLPQVKTSFAAALIFAQTLLILGVVALLEQHPLPFDVQKRPPGPE